MTSAEREVVHIFFPKPGTSGLICGIRFLGFHVSGCNISAYECCTLLCFRTLFTVLLRLFRFSLFFCEAI